MNTISIQNDMIARFKTAQVLPVHPLPRRVTPGVATARRFDPSPTVKPAQTLSKPTGASSLWMSLDRGTKAETAVMGVLGGGALVAIAYGFATSLDLMQNWPAFNSWVSQITR